MTETAESIRILHVDDDPSLSELVATFLEREDDRIIVQTATNPEDGMEILAGHDIDCIVSDYDMPGQNGVEFLESVREVHPNLPFILYTGKGSEEVASEAISSGVSDYLQKEAGTEQYTVLANRIINLVTQYRAELQVEQFNRLREESMEYRDRLLEIALDHDRTTDETIQDLLALGCERFGVENGHLVMIDREKGRHDVVSVVGSDIVQKGLSDLSNTYCRKTIESESHQEIYNAVEQGWDDDPAYESYGIGCYLGSKLTVGDRTVGTVCFVDEDSRDPFTHNERAFFDMLSRWLNQVLERQRLKQAETIFENAQDAVFVVDVTNESSFTIQHVNPAYEALTGLQTEEMHGKTPREILGEKQGKAVEQNFQECVNQRQPIEYEEQLSFGDNTQYWQTRLAPIVETGTVTQLIGVTREITERQAHLEELQEEQLLVDSLFRSLPDPLYAFDTEGYPIRWNEQLEATTGYAPEEIEDMHVTEFVPADESETIAENFRTILEERRSVAVESAIRTKSGERIPHEFTGGPLEDADGNLRGVTGVGRDISAWKRTERMLRGERRRFEQLLETSPTAITVLDRDGQITRANERAEEVLGLTDSAITDRTYDDPEWHIIDEEGEPIPAEDLPFARVMESGEPVYDYEHGIKWPGGRERWLSINAAPITTDGDEIEQVVATMTDVTESREHERAIREQNERLERFASIVSHDLRNPLSVANGKLELAKEECESDHLEAIGRAHERMEALITDLLILARQGEIATDITTVDLAEIMQSCWRNVDTADASLVSNVDRTIRADESRLRQLFENLIRNSIEHGDEGVTVTVGELDDGFYMEDDGPGIPEDDRDDVFEAGYSTSEKGTGFGLSIVKQVVQAHNWEIRVTEGSEGGARFEVTGVKFAA